MGQRRNRFLQGYGRPQQQAFGLLAVVVERRFGIDKPREPCLDCINVGIGRNLRWPQRPGWCRLCHPGEAGSGTFSSGSMISKEVGILLFWGALRPRRIKFRETPILMHIITVMSYLNKHKLHLQRITLKYQFTKLIKNSPWTLLLPLKSSFSPISTTCASNSRRRKTCIAKSACCCSSVTASRRLATSFINWCAGQHERAD